MEEIFALRRKRQERDSEAQKEAQKLTAIKREEKLGRKLKNLELEQRNGSSRNSLSNVSSSVRAADKIENCVYTPMNKFGATGDLSATAALMKADSQNTCKSGVKTLPVPGIGVVKLEVSQFNTVPEMITGLICDPFKLSISSFTVRQPDASSKPAAQNQSFQFAMSRSTPFSSVSLKLP